VVTHFPNCVTTDVQPMEPSEALHSFCQKNEARFCDVTMANKHTGVALHFGGQ
jgi:hypothetical protein